MTIRWNVVANVNRSCVVSVNALTYMLTRGGILVFTYSSLRSRSTWHVQLYMLTLSADVGESGWATTCYGQWLGKHPNAFNGGLFSILKKSFWRLSELAMVKSTPIPNEWDHGIPQNLISSGYYQSWSTKTWSRHRHLLWCSGGQRLCSGFSEAGTEQTRLEPDIWP